MRVIGLISGTSVDGIDAALIDISGSTLDLKVTFIAGETISYPSDLREKILTVCGGSPLSMAELAELDDAIAYEFAQAALAIQQQSPATKLIGSHGQTVFHRPPVDLSQKLDNMSGSSLGYSLQLGRGELIAHLTNIPTVSNFRAADIAVGGQGAPLVSKMDAYLLSHPEQSSCIQNIGGIGNVTYLPARGRFDDWEQHICGWDTGPGNSLIDLAVSFLTKGEKNYDCDGRWAAMGRPCEALVQQWLQQPFFLQAPPKSTGRELFGNEYLQQCLRDCQTYNVASAADVLATLTELTVASIAHSYRSFLPQMPDRVLLCGGGSKNPYLTQRLQSRMGNIPVLTTDAVGLNADFKEAIAFAVLAYWRIHNIPGNLPNVTGAKQPVLLGNVHNVVVS